MDKNTGEELILNGKTVTAEQVFTTGASNKKNGAVQDSFTLEFTITQDMQEDLPGKDMVIYETLYVQDGKTWHIAAEHKDLKDQKQTVSNYVIQTGDETPLIIFIGLAVFALAGIVFVIWKKRKLSKEK